MTICVLCNLGLRDVRFDGDPITPARVQGKVLVERKDLASAHFSFPILQSSLAYILNRHSHGIDQLIIFATDQPEESEHHKNDTLYFADLVQQHLATVCNGQVHSMLVKLIQHINPSFYDEALEVFDTLLADVPKLDIDACYILLGGGIPACNTALLFHGVRYYGDRLHVIYTPEGGSSQEIRASSQVEAGFQEAAAIKHLERLDFANAVPILAKLNIQRGLHHLAEYAAQRFNFDFSSAQTTLDAVRREGDTEVRRFVERKQTLLILDAQAIEDQQKPLTPQQILALLCELHWNAAITYQHHRYADFLGRVYRFQEAVLRYLIEMIFKLSTDLKPALRQKTLTEWESGIKAHVELWETLEQTKVENKPLDWRMINRPTYQAMLSYALKQNRAADGTSLMTPGEQKQREAILDRLNKLNRLVELRHRTIIGHDFQGVSAELIAQYFTPSGDEQTPVDRLATILRMLQADIQKSPYDAISSFICNRLRSHRN